MKDDSSTKDPFGSNVDFAQLQTPKYNKVGEKSQFEKDDKNKLEAALDRAGIDITSLNALRRLRQFVQNVEKHPVHQVVFSDQDVAPDRMDVAPYRDLEDMKKIRYTACSTKVPHHFWRDGYQLRVAQQLRSIEILIAVTSYNEEPSEFERTLFGINKNMENWVRKTGDEEIWKKIMLIIVADGRSKVNPGTFTFLQKLGLFDEDLMFECLGTTEKEVTMHLFERTLQMGIDGKGIEQGYYPPLQTVFAMKENNGGKLDSHLWFFNAFAEHIQPKYCVLMDVGTMPRPEAILKLYMAMEQDRDIGGCCGEIAVHKSNRFNIVEATQEYEYKISNVLDKSLESSMGYITVLPGAFSAYRYEAIRGDTADSPLAVYFVSLTSSLKDLGVFKGNMFLAEDRILGFELLVRSGEKWYMKYVNDAIAETDVPKTLVDLIKQRRRWLNGSFFALLYALLNFNKLFKSAHPSLRKFTLLLQFAYLSVNALLSWFVPANFMIIFLLLVADIGYGGTQFPLVLGYFLLLMVQFIAAIAVAPGDIPKFYSFTSTCFGILVYLQVGYLIFISTTTANLTTLILFFVILTLPYAAAVLHGFGSLFQLILTTAQYYFMLPTLLNSFLIYAFCNTHDLSWGTKGLESGSHNTQATLNVGDATSDKVALSAQNAAYLSAKKKDDMRRLATAANDRETVKLDFEDFRTSMVLFFILSNVVLILVGTRFIVRENEIQGDVSYINALFTLIIALYGIRFVGSFVYVLKEGASRMRLTKQREKNILLGLGPDGKVQSQRFEARTVQNPSYANSSCGNQFVPSRYAEY